MNLNVGERLSYRNVIRKIYYDISNDSLQETIEQFLSNLEHLGVDPNGPLIYNYQSIYKDGSYDIEMMIPVTDIVTDYTEVQFMSYLHITDMLHSRFKSKDFIKEERQVMKTIVDYVNDNGLMVVSPYYHIVNRTTGNIEIKVKVSTYRD
ncbi:DUF5085 family protein [Macrococcus capreoli]